MHHLFPHLTEQFLAKRLLIPNTYYSSLAGRRCQHWCNAATVHDFCHMQHLRSRKLYKGLIFLKLVFSNCLSIDAIFHNQGKLLLPNFLRRENVIFQYFSFECIPAKGHTSTKSSQSFCMVLTTAEASVLALLSKTSNRKITFCLFLESHLGGRDRKEYLISPVQKSLLLFLRKKKVSKPSVEYQRTVQRRCVGI